jgi:predicted dehydrogenase
MISPIKVGIVGYGFSTKCFHLPFILPNHELEVHAFLQRAAAPSADPASKSKAWGHCTVDFPRVKHYQTADEFFADVAIELVVICAHTHREFVEKALKAGKHGKRKMRHPSFGPKANQPHLPVVVEKPFVATSSDADELIELAKAQGKVLTVFHSTRLALRYYKYEI